MIIQNRDGSLIEEPFHTRKRDHDNHYYAEVDADDLDRQTSLVERIIVMAFDVLGARHLEVLVHGNDNQ